ncbi:MAG: elongation factor G [Rhodocyclaceae bacterium]|nr:elongation factor G [Rhodocyclaceae bacterium]
MAKFHTERIRAIALVGHGGAGKTTLAEAMLARAGVIAAAGSVEKGNTVCDYDPQEKAVGHSLQSALVNFAWEDVHIHLIDTPGYPDFAGQALAALAGVDTAVVVINAQTGVELMTERMMKAAAERGLARMIVVNKIDADNLDLSALMVEIRERFGPACKFLDLPSPDHAKVVEVLEHDVGETEIDTAAHAHRELIDQLVEEDESLMMRYLEDGKEPTSEELHAPFEKALREGHLIPVLFTSAKTGAGIDELLHVLATLAPNPTEANLPPFYRDGEPFQRKPDANQHVLAHVFKIIMDPYMGKVAVFRVHQGTLRKDTALFAGEGKKSFKPGHLYQLQGKEFIEVDELLPGDLGAIAKIDEIEFDCVLHDSHDEDRIQLKPLEFPKPMQGLAVETTKKGDEQRLFELLHKLELEDPCFRVERHPATNETVIFGLGEVHLKTKLERLANLYKLELTTKPPQIPYRETITRPAEGHHRHKKQTGGAGQFGEVFLRVEPLPRGAGFEFVDQVKGGVIPSVFMPAVEKGVRQALEGGVVAGFPVEDVRVIVYDGKTHPVDGKEVAFVQAGKKATIAAIQAASPVVLEPIMKIEVTVPEEQMGDIAGDLSARRGHVTGTHARGAGRIVVEGEVPLAEINDYASKLKSMTGGQGSYSIEFSRYAQVPPPVQQKLMASFKLKEDEE